MKFLPNGREYLRADERDHSKGWTWNDGGDRRTPCDAETCAMLDHVMLLYQRLGRTPEEGDLHSGTHPADDPAVVARIIGAALSARYCHGYPNMAELAKMEKAMDELMTARERYGRGDGVRAAPKEGGA